jgi:hypothetical protein
MSDAATTQPTAKSLLKSKTFWLQVISLAGIFYPPVQAWVAANPVTAVAALGAANTLVRLVTSGRISIFEPEEGEKNTGGRGSLPALLVVGAAVGLLGAALPSCSPGLPVKARVLLEEGALSYSSKGGLEMEYRPGYGEMPEVYRNSAK